MVHLRSIQMIYEDEKLIFIKELGRLIEDYQKCEDQKYKELIYDDIMQLIEIIN
ncbi:hypothetical protein [Mesobacillus foraminis]|uniref:hypothetical protein n=1 Tax=Mesobacillus foraminis TaxID=279826 RepID=UPI0013CEAB2F|nr:hypothetical protein [Mesobacillus foraminis]